MCNSSRPGLVSDVGTVLHAVEVYSCRSDCIICPLSCLFDGIPKTCYVEYSSSRSQYSVTFVCGAGVVQDDTLKGTVQAVDLVAFAWAFGVAGCSQTNG